jgi:hypothetical protein
MRDVASDRDEAAFRHWQPPPSRSRLPTLPRIGDWFVMGAKPAVDLNAMMKSISLAMSAEKQASAACNRSLLSAVETSLPKPIDGLQRLDSPE